MNEYVPKYYNIVGYADLVSINEVRLKWGDELKKYYPVSENYITIAERKSK